GLALSPRSRRPVELRIRAARWHVEVARDVALAEWIGGRAAPLSGEQRDRQPVLAVAVAGEQVAVIQPEAVAAGAGAERRHGERIVPAAAFLAIAGTQRERLLPLPLHSRARVLEVRVGKVDVSRLAQP